MSRQLPNGDPNRPEPSGCVSIFAAVVLFYLFIALVMYLIRIADHYLETQL